MFFRSSYKVSQFRATHLLSRCILVYEQPFPTEIKIMKKPYFLLVLYRVNFSNLFVVNQMNMCNTSLKKTCLVSFNLLPIPPFNFTSYIGQKKKTYPIRVGYLIKSSRFFYSGGKLKRKRFRKNTFMVTYIILEIWTNSRVIHTEKTDKFPENFAVHLILFQCRNFSET